MIIVKPINVKLMEMKFEYRIHEIRYKTDIFNCESKEKKVIAVSITVLRKTIPLVPKDDNCDYGTKT